MPLDVDIVLAPGRAPGGAVRRFELRACFASGRERIVLFGASGAGKSVTLQAIAGLMRPQSGRIALAGRVLFDAALGIALPARERRVGYLFQDYALFPHMSVTRNIAFGLLPTLAWRIDAAARRRVERVMDALDIASLGAQRPDELSGGQRQRVALARALVREPELLLLDEPFSALDAALRTRVRRELEEVRRRFDVPMVLITHDLEDVRQFADTLVVFDAGRVVQIADRDAGDPERLARIAAASLAATTP